ncbi:MAG: porin family protein [Ferruginibacter sp.]
MNTRNILCLPITFAFMFSAVGQPSISSIGIETGPSVTSVRGNEIIQRQNNSIGYAFNIFYQHHLNKIFSLHSSIGYERKGSEFSLVATDYTGMPIGKVHGYSRWNYLTMPVMIRATFGKRINYFVNAGPYIAYLLKQVYGNKAGVLPAGQTNNINNDQRIDFGISLGAGLSLPLTKNIALSFEARDNLGLYNVSKAKVINNGTIKHNSINVLFGILYALHSGNKKNQNS